MKIIFDSSKQLNRSSWLKLMGVNPGNRAESDMPDDSSGNGKISNISLPEGQEQEMSEIEQLLYEAAEPRFIYRILDVEQLVASGRSLEKHLEGCSRVIIMAVTLGIGVDTLIRRTQAKSMATAVITDFGASVMAELAADMAAEEIHTYVAGLAESEGRHLFTTARFSPGYGDSPLDMQGQLLKLLNAERSLGITLTESNMMIPRKSITGILGLADHPVSGRLATCAECVLKEKCTLRMEGRRCY